MLAKPRAPTPLAASGLLLLAALTGCTRQAPVPPACIDVATDTVRIRVTNDGAAPMQVPQSRPDIGCCRRSGLTIAVTDASGNDLDRCGFADNFDLAHTVELRPGASIQYAVSAPTLANVYCQVELERHYLSVHDGARPLGTHPLRPCGETADQRQAPQGR